MAVIELKRRCRGRVGGKNGQLSDLHVWASANKCEKRSFAIGLRISDKVLKRMKWIAGDLVVASYDTDSKSWLIRRVRGEEGNVISKTGGGNTAHGTVKFSVDGDYFSVLNIPAGGGYDCEMVGEDGDTATFI